MACVVSGCNSHSSELKDNKKDKLSFHRRRDDAAARSVSLRGNSSTVNGNDLKLGTDYVVWMTIFPVDSDVREKWIENIRRPDWNPTKHSKICSLHFDPSCYRDGPQRKVLHSYAVPTIFSDQLAYFHQNIPKKRIVTVRKRNISAPPSSTSKSKAFIASSAKLIQTNEDSGQGMSRKRKLPMQARVTCAPSCSTSTSNALVASSSKEIETNECQILPEKAKETILDGTNIIITSTPTNENVVPNKRGRTAEAFDSAIYPKYDSKKEINHLESQLNRYKNLAQRRRRKLKNSQRKCSRLLEKIASLESVIKELNSKMENEHVTILRNCTILPHPKTVAKWYQTINCEPGFTKESFDTIKLRCAENSKTLYCALSMEEMAICKQLQWDGKKYHGQITVSKGSESDNLPLASEAIVFMVTCINQSWKIPVGYFFINSLTGQQKKYLIEQCLSLLNETGIKTLTLTFDGAEANASMAKELGELNPECLKTSFEIGGQEVPILYDPCHNIKSEMPLAKNNHS